MVIQTGNVSMSASHTSRQERAGLLSYTGWAGSLDNALSASTLPLATDSRQQTDVEEDFDVTEIFAQMNSEPSVAESKLKNCGMEEPVLTGEAKIKRASFGNLLELLFPNASGKVRTFSFDEMTQTISAHGGWSFLEEEKLTTEVLLKRLIEELKLKVAGISASASRSYGGNAADTMTQTVWTVESVNYDLYYESEASNFTSDGTVITADGRKISFNLEASMSRSFMECTGMKINYGAQMFVDPLVISLDEAGIEVTDQKFLFDIDADGELDNISLLGQMCGYLALDRNGDGIINNGSELFGTQSGDGFRDLAVFDLDGNGWIDENDEVFNHLRIWTKGADGEDKLIGLGVAGVGAIYLGSVANEFTFKSENANETQAMQKSTGIYLKESGQAGVISQLDMAVAAS